MKKFLLFGTTTSATHVFAHSTGLHTEKNMLLHWVTQADHLTLLIAVVVGVGYAVYRLKSVK